jgi:hypothetical protein
MFIFGLKALHEHLHLYKIVNPHKYFNSHVVKCLVLLIIANE